MASKRVSKSAINWAKMFETASQAELPAMRAFKARQDGYVARVHKYAETMKPIDFAAYKNKVANPAVVDMLEKEYNAVKIPYPKDNQNVAAQVDVIKLQDKEEQEAIGKVLQDHVDLTKAYLAEVDRLPAFNQMTLDMYRDYFPGALREPKLKDPNLFPPTEDQRRGHLRIIPLQCFDYKDNIRDAVDFVLMKGKYEGEFERANAHLKEKKTTQQVEPAAEAK